MVCEFIPAEYRVTYNTQGNIEKISKSYWSSSTAEKVYTIYYYPSGIVKEFNFFESGPLIKKKIELI
jgi:hypothetical protein